MFGIESENIVCKGRVYLFLVTFLLGCIVSGIFYEFQQREIIERYEWTKENLKEAQKDLIMSKYRDICFGTLTQLTPVFKIVKLEGFSEEEFLSYVAVSTYSKQILENDILDLVFHSVFTPVPCRDN